MPFFDFLLRLAGLAIPVLAVMIPLVVVTGKFIVQPLLQSRSGGAASLAPEERTRLEGRIAMLEDRLEGLERCVLPMVEEHEFQRQLASGRELR